MTPELKFKLNMVLEVLEHCFGELYISIPEILSRWTEADILFYYENFHRLEVIKL